MSKPYGECDEYDVTRRVRELRNESETLQAFCRRLDHEGILYQLLNENIVYVQLSNTLVPRFALGGDDISSYSSTQQQFRF